MRMLADLTQLTTLKERRSAGGQKAAADDLRAQLAAVPALEVKEYLYTYNGNPYVNLEVTIPGIEDKQRTILAGAHFDCTSNDASRAPGADDNASGTVAVLEAARALAGCQPRQSIRLLFFSNEEAGTVGSREYVKAVKGSLLPADVVGFINVDMVGFGPDGEDLDIATKPAYQSLADHMAGAVQQHTTLTPGGTDGGDEKHVLANARALAKCQIRSSILYAGNRTARDAAGELLSGRDIVAVPNVMPEIGEMNIEPAREAIRRIFLQRIVEGKGLAELVRKLGVSPQPTPLAVYELVRVLPAVCPEWRDLGLLDIGGATTDFYSHTDAFHGGASFVLRGLLEPRMKRTVEGDVGLRVSAPALTNPNESWAVALASAGPRAPRRGSGDRRPAQLSCGFGDRRPVQPSG